MKNKIILLLVICAFYTPLCAQNPESVVREYVRLLNDWLASPYDFDKREKLNDILTDRSGNCTMTDEIVERYNKDAGDEHCFRNAYLSILSDFTINRTIKVEILGIRNIESQFNREIVTVRLKYSGGINLTTTSEFWVYGNKIGYIDKGRNIVEKEKTVYVEKEKIVEVESSDQNTGKAYLLLKISEPDAEVYVDYHAYKVSGRDIKINLPYGYYNVRVSKAGYETEQISVKLNGEPVEKEVILRIAMVDMRVEKDYDAILYVDGIFYGKQNVVSVRADQRHTIKVEKNSRSKTKTVRAYQKSFTVVMPSISTESKPQSDWFLGYTISPDMMSSGFSVGNCKRTGFILNGGFSILAFKNWYNRNLEEGGFLDTFNIHDVILDNNQMPNTKSMGLYRSYIRFGPMFRVFNFLYLYAAAGCGTYAEIGKYDGKVYASTIHKGFEGEAGLMLKYKRIGVSFGYTRNIGKEIFTDYNLGLHYWLRFLKNQVNPQNKFIIGYRFSPSAPIGMSLGVSFGRYQKWGLILNGGFSPYSMYVWQKRGEENDSYYPEGFWMEEIRSVSLAEQKEWEEYKDKGIFRSYYHIGPFFRVNNIFSYYLTLGYGNYAHIRKYSGRGHDTELHSSVDLYAGNKLHNGVDGEIGFMLKFGRVGFSVGYQHNIGIHNRFQDINAGMQIWLGR